MYHIPNDKRARQSAELIWEGLCACLEEKELNRIRISDIHEKSYVSRATFYRLFDSIEDVLAYRCDKIFEGVLSTLSEGSPAPQCDVFLFFAERWLEQQKLIRTLASNNLTRLLYDTHVRYSGIVKAVIQEENLTEKEIDYLISILSNILPAVIDAWHRLGQKETASELYAISAKCIKVTSDAVNGSSMIQI